MAQTSTVRRSARNAFKTSAQTTSNGIKPEQSPSPQKGIKREPSPPPPEQPVSKRTKTTSPSKTPKSSAKAGKQSPQTTEEKAALLRDRKLKSYANKTPFPDFAHPTPEECRLAHRILAKLHGDRVRSSEPIKAPTASAGCGNSPSVLDALVRTILSQNTSDKNSSRAKKSMDEEYGGSDQWEKIVEGGRERLQKTIASGGLSVVKSKVIISILEQAYEKYGTYSLDHLFEASNEDAMHEMLSFSGVGPKTASCVLLFCLQRESFAVDTHVYRLAGLLGWRPAKADREQTHAHLDAMIPDEEKYALHILLIKHGKVCEECKAGGRSAGKCELRKAFRGKGVKEEELEDDAKERVKGEVEDRDSDKESVKAEDEQEEVVKTEDGEEGSKQDATPVKKEEQE